VFRFRFNLLVAALLLSVAAFAQRSDFPLLYSSGKLPYEFITPPEKRAQERIEKRKNAGEILSQKDVDFIYTSEYTFSYFVESGFVTTGDEVSLYAARIIERLLKNEPDLNGRISTYIVRTDDARFFSFDNGIILLSIGLLSKLENEAQLAYLLARECIHIREKHAEQNYSDIDLAKVKYLNRVNVYSAEQEFQTDKKALRLYSDAGYSVREAVNALVNLSRYDYCFGEAEFSPVFFEHDDYVFPENYYLERLAVDYYDTITPYYIPKAKERIDALKATTAEMKSEQQTTGFETEVFFLYIRKLCREELLRCYLNNQKYEEAIYGAFILLKDDSSNYTAKNSIAQSLSTLALYTAPDREQFVPNVLVLSGKNVFSYTKKDDDKFKFRDQSQCRGEVQRVNFLLKSMSNVELTILALDKVWEFYNYDNTNKDISNRSKLLMNILTANYNLSIETFATTPFSSKEIGLKNDSIKAKNNKKQPIIDDTFTPEAIVVKDVWQDYAKQQEKSIDDKAMQVFGQKQKDLGATVTVEPVKVYVSWKKALPDREYLNLEYNYYDYAFLHHMNDPLFKSRFINSPKLITKEFYTKSSFPSENSQKRYGQGLGQDFFIIAFVNAVDQVAASSDDLFVTKPESSSELREFQRYAIHNQIGYNIAKPAAKPLYQLKENDTTGYSMYCVSRLLISDLYNNSAEDCYMPPIIYSHMRDTICKYYQTYIIFSSYILNQQIGTSKRARITSVAYDMTTGKQVLYWNEEHRQRIKQSLINTYYLKVLHEIYEGIAINNQTQKSGN
jgi:hypothetical protein